MFYRNRVKLSGHETYHICHSSERSTRLIKAKKNLFILTIALERIFIIIKREGKSERERERMKNY